MPKLKHLDLEISNPCNERCIHCYRTCKHTKQGFLSIEDVAKIFDEIKPIRESHIDVVLTGGEALLNKEWRNILEFCISQNSRVSLFTNGSLINKDDVKFLAQFRDSPNFREVQISLYSLSSEIHDAITGLKGSWKKTLDAIKMLKSEGVKVFVSSPVMQTNKDSIADLMRWMDSNDIRSCADLLIFPNSDYQNRNISQKLNKKDFDVFYNKTAENNFELGYIWGFNRKRDNLLDTLFYAPAANGILVSGNGNIYPMIGWYEKLGNIHNDSLKAVFLKAPLLKKCRQIKILDFRECCECEAIGYCSFCPTTHITANHGALMKLNQDYCEKVHLLKQMAERRDAEMRKMNRQH